MQRDHYLPLKVIREHLDARARGEQLPLPAAAQPEPAGAPAAVPKRLDRATLLAASGADEHELADWEAYGLLTPDADGVFAPEAVTVARLISELGRHGLQPRHLRGVKAAAEREAGLVAQVVAPLRRNRDSRTRADAESTAHRLADLSVRLHAALVRSALRAEQG
jgi:hypothetical protein